MQAEVLNHAPTVEQATILEAGAATNSNIMISAYAGTGKTSTLEMLDAVLPKGPHLYLCFNKSVAKEAEKRMVSTTTVRTFNSLGHRIWAAACAKNLALDTKKQGAIFRQVIDGMKKGEKDEAWGSYDLVMHGVNLARAVGYIPADSAKAGGSLISQSRFHGLLDETPNDLESDLIDACLLRSIKQSYDGLIDFNDQIYMPAFFGGTYPKFPIVLIDEYQDLSPTNHAMVAKLCKVSRQIGVGDDAQSIYGFRGAKSGGMSQAVGQYSMFSFPLSISFRCPSAIVSNVHWRVPSFKASRKGGLIHAPTSIDLTRILDGSAIICRNNAPLMGAAFALISADHGVSVAGTDIGPRLIATLRRLGPESLTQGQTLSVIEDWLARKLEKESKTAEDFAACMRIFAKQTTSLGAAIAYAEHIFRQDGTIRLMTGHKAKGLEFDHVYHLDQDIIRTHTQDLNLKYVIDTRARESLTYISSSMMA